MIEFVFFRVIWSLGCWRRDMRDCGWIEEIGNTGGMQKSLIGRGVR